MVVTWGRRRRRRIRIIRGRRKRERREEWRWRRRETHFIRWNYGCGGICISGVFSVTKSSSREDGHERREAQAAEGRSGEVAWK